LEKGGANPFLGLVAEDPEVPLDRSELDALLNPTRFVGRAPEQVREFLTEHVRPILDDAVDLPEAKDLDV
jgi:adenylosuccinate lyase